MFKSLGGKRKKENKRASKCTGSPGNVMKNIDLEGRVPPTDFFLPPFPVVS